MDVFAALADPTRRALLRRLAVGPARVVDLAADHPMSRPAISRHLRVLGDAGVVSATDAGRERHYSLERAPLSEVRALIDELEQRPPIAERHLDALDTEVRRTRRHRRTENADTTPTRLEDSA